MSKIQKALGLLRQSGTVQPPADGGSDATGLPTNGQGAPRVQHPPRRRMPLRRPSATDVPAESENLPDQRMHIDPESLVAAGLYPNGDHGEQIRQQFRRIKRPVINLAFGEGQPEAENTNMVMVASALPRSGKTWCSINLAASIARERDVGAVLVDADVLKPNISRALGLSERVGLIDHLFDPVVTMDDIIVPTDFHDIVVIPAGQQHDEATELLASRRMEQFVAELSHRFRGRMVVVDTPPLLLTNEAQVLAEHMGQIVMVIEAGVTMQESVVQALESLNRSKPVNAILNKARSGFFADYSAGAYGGGYGYYSLPKNGAADD